MSSEDKGRLNGLYEVIDGYATEISLINEINRAVSTENLIKYTLDGYTTKIYVDGYAASIKSTITTETNRAIVVENEIKHALDGYGGTSATDGYATVTYVDGYVSSFVLVETNRAIAVENEIISVLDGYATATYVDGYVSASVLVETNRAIAVENEIISALDGYATVTYVDGYVSASVLVETNRAIAVENEIISALDGYATVTYVDGYVSSSVLVETNRAIAVENEIISVLDGYATVTYVDGYVSASVLVETNRAIAVENEIKSALDGYTDDGYVSASVLAETNRAISVENEIISVLDGYNRDVVYFGPPAGSSVSDHTALQALFKELKVLDTRPTIVFRPSPGIPYYFTTCVLIPSGEWRIEGPGPDTLMLANIPGLNSDSCIFMQFLSNLSFTPNTTLTSDMLPWSRTISVADLCGGQLKCGKYINSSNIVREVIQVTGTGPYLVELSDPTTNEATSATGSLVYIINPDDHAGGTAGYSTLIADWKGTRFAALGNTTHKFQTAANAFRNYVANAVIVTTFDGIAYDSPDKGFNCDFGACECVYDHIIADVGAGTHAVGAGWHGMEGDYRCEYRNCTFNGMTAFGITGSTKCKATNCHWFGRNYGSSTGPFICGTQGAHSFGNVIQDCSASGVFRAFQIDDCLIAEPLALESRSDAFINCKCFDSPHPLTLKWSTTTGKIYDPVFRGIDADATGVPGGCLGFWTEGTTDSTRLIGGELSDFYMHSDAALAEGNAGMGAAFYPRLMKNISISQATAFLSIASGNAPVVIQQAHWYCRIGNTAKTLIDFTAGNSRLVFIDSVIDTNGHIAYAPVAGNVIEFINSKVTCGIFSRNDGAAISYRRSNCPTFTGTVGAKAILNYQNVTLTGATPVNVAFADAKLSDFLNVTIITEAGTPGPIKQQLVPGTGATITGTAGDTSIIQVVFK
jgi:hypothetical protein